MWIEIRKFYEHILKFTAFDDERELNELFNEIEKHKWRMSNVLSNPKNKGKDRDKVVPNGKVNIADVEITLDEQICAEALIMSDVFDLGELEAVDLVLAGEAQKIHFEGLNRGLIAVVCYYDAHRLLITAIRHMLKWDREELPSRVCNFLDDTFVNDNIVKMLFQVLTSFTVQSEFARLQAPNVNGLGGSKHQKLVKNAIEEIRNEIIGCISLICEFPGSEAVSISNYLFGIVKVVPPEKLNLTNMTAWVSLIKLTSSDVLTQVQEAPQVLTNMIANIRNETDWSDQAMCGTLQLACAITLKSIASSPADHLGIENIKVDVERVIDRAIRNMAFQYLRQAIIRSDHFRFAHQFIVIDELLKQLVAFFPAKLMETERNSADELTFLDEQQKDVLNAKPDPRSQTVNIGDKLTASLSSSDPSSNYESALSNYENFLRSFVDLYEMQVMDHEHQKASRTTRERELFEQIQESSLSFSTERSSNIRQFNSALALASMGAQVEEFRDYGLYSYKIHEQIYLAAGPLHPSTEKALSYGQLYTMDTKQAAEERRRELS
uniref:Uncharacterized protein n=1 Tax=Caenorhabditis japonica TaxID=281687 RepID=A0A8R1DII9_CAEJA